MKELKHHGILGMKWGVRRYQNPDGTLTAAGKARYDYYIDSKGNTKYKKKDVSKMTDRELGAQSNQKFTKFERMTAENKYRNTVKQKVSNMTDEELGAKKGQKFSAKERAEAEDKMKSNLTKDISNMTDQELGAKKGQKFSAKERAEAENNYKNFLRNTDKDLQDLQSIRSIANDARQISDSARTFSRSDYVQNRYNNRKVLTQKELDSMDNRELQELITRMNLESQYSRLTADKVPPSTRERVTTGLEYTSAILGITGSALGIAASVYAIKNNK